MCVFDYDNNVFMALVKELYETLNADEKVSVE